MQRGHPHRIPEWVLIQGLVCPYRTAEQLDPELTQLQVPGALPHGGTHTAGMGCTSSIPVSQISHLKSTDQKQTLMPQGTEHWETVI